jgi:hypothetical protein
VTPRNKKAAKPAWVERLSKKIIPESRVFKHDKPRGSMKAIHNEVVQVTRNKARVLIKKGPVKLRSVKAKKSGTFLQSVKTWKRN